MNEKPMTGSADAFRKSEFISAAETLLGKTRREPFELVISRAVICDDVIADGGKKESGVPAIVLATPAGKELGLRMRVNATRRKMITAANDSVQWKLLQGKNIPVRLYHTVDSDRVTGGKTATAAIGMDIWCKPMNDWLRYYDYQQPRGRAHVESSGLADNFADIDIPAPQAVDEPPEADPLRGTRNDAGDWYGLNDAGEWIDSSGEVYSPDAHGWSDKNDSPAYTKAGLFRAKRGTADVEPTQTQTQTEEDIIK